MRDSVVDAVARLRAFVDDDPNLFWRDVRMEDATTVPVHGQGFESVTLNLQLGFMDRKLTGMDIMRLSTSDKRLKEES